MAGWVVVWIARGQVLDYARWNRTADAAARYGERVSTVVSDNVAVATWRRERGEFPHSGRIVYPATDSCTAWLGQCLGDSEDKSLEAIGLLATRAAPLEAVADLNGPFAAAVVHKNPRTVSIWTDRQRHYPVYLHRNGRMNVASTEMRCIVPWLSSPRLNVAAVDLMLRCGELIDRMTLLEEVEVLPGGTCVKDENGQQVERQYWRIRFRPDHSLTLNEYATRLSERLLRASRRIEASCPRLGVPLSGGLDSRLILGLCENPRHVPSFTWGLPGCRDIRCATAFASAISSPHQTHFWNPQAFVPLWKRGVDRTAGAIGVHEMFMLPFVRTLADYCDVVLNGLAGDVFLGGNFLKRSWLRQRDLSTLAKAAWRWRVTPQQDEWANRLLGHNTAADSGQREWSRSILLRADGGPIEVLNAWLLENRMFRFTNCGTMLLRGGVESHAPFFDRDVVDLLLRVPFEYKVRHRLYLKVVDRACSAAARVPWQRTGIPPAWGFWPNLVSMALQRGMRKALRPFGIEPFPTAAVADPARWFRQDWRQATEQILFSQRSLDRGLFNPDLLRSLWRMHQRGADFTRQIGVLTTIELFAGMVIDGDSEIGPQPGA